MPHRPSTAALILQETFEDHPLTFVRFNGEPVVVARELATALGYAEPSRLGALIRDEWAAEFTEGTDFRLLDGASLSAFKAQWPDTPEHGVSTLDRTRRALLVLTESGLWMVAQKTEKALGVKLRRFLATKVLPRLARGEGIPAAAPAPVIDLAAERARRADRRLDLAERKVRLQEGAVVARLVDDLHGRGKIGDDVRDAYSVTAAEISAGRPLTGLLPVVTEAWFTPTEIAQRFGVTANRIGRTVSALGLRGPDGGAGLPGFSRAVVNKAAGHDKTVTSYVYNEAAVKKIGEVLEVASSSAS
jgi:prophage antirepressor-like protein